MIQQRFRFFLCLLIGGFAFLPSAWSQMRTVTPATQTLITINNQRISESSGLACSTRDEHLLWTHNDSGHMPIIYAMSDQGTDKDTYHLEDIESIDWEDMDAFQYQGKHYLLIADTGDNFKMLLQHRISIFQEPVPGRQQRSALSPSWSFYFQYEDGHAYDVESVAVDIVREKIVLLTKRTKPTMMFELPLQPRDEETIQQAIQVDSLPDIVNPSALDISADGQLMSINTYRRIHRFHRENPAQRWQYVDSVKYKHLFQPEAMCLSNNNKHYYVSSEKQSLLLKIVPK